MLVGSGRFFASLRRIGFALEKTGLRRLFDGQVVSFDIYDDRGRNAAGNIIILK